MSFNLLKKITHLSDQSGVYQFFDSTGKMVYVGKAKNLKKRITSYFRKNNLDQKTKSMMQKVVDVKIMVTENENQALL